LRAKIEIEVNQRTVLSIKKVYSEVLLFGPALYTQAHLYDSFFYKYEFSFPVLLVRPERPAYTSPGQVK
jgi:hypothetical protein